MSAWLLEAVAEHPVAAIITIIGSMLGALAAIWEAHGLRDQVADLRERVARLEASK
jgi:hypothetical protein